MICDTYFVVSFGTTAKLLLIPEIVNIVYYRKINIILASNILSVILHMILTLEDSAQLLC